MIEEHRGLAEILKYHVISGVMTAKEFTALGSVVSVNGQRLNIDSQPGRAVWKNGRFSRTDYGPNS